MFLIPRVHKVREQETSHQEKVKQGVVGRLVCMVKNLKNKIMEEEDKIGDVIGFSLATSQPLDVISSAIYPLSAGIRQHHKRRPTHNMAIKYWLACPTLERITFLRSFKRTVSTYVYL